MGNPQSIEGFKRFLSKSSLPTMTDMERKAATILIVDSDSAMRSSIRTALVSLGFANVSDAADHALALTKAQERRFTHVVFEARQTNMPSKDFLYKLLEGDPSIVAVASSFEPTVDDVFGLLISGARGYLVKPFTPAAIDDAMVMATKGEPISEAILFAKDRNEALASLVLTALDKLSLALRQAPQFETAKRDLPKLRAAFRRALDIAHTFAENGDDALLEAILDFCIERSNGPATRLGRLRQRLGQKRSIHPEQRQPDPVS